MSFVWMRIPGVGYLADEFRATMLLQRKTEKHMYTQTNVTTMKLNKFIETGRERDRQTDRQTDRDRKREREREFETDRERERGRDLETHTLTESCCIVVLRPR